MHRTTYGNALICLPAGTRALALPLLEAILAEYPNEQLAHCIDTQDYFQEKVDNSDLEDSRTNCHTRLQRNLNTCWLASLTSARVLVLRVPINFVLLFAFVGLSS